ncbi:MAG TPA: methionine ABC transporter ATP-binding protein [Halanaerobiaceae bacterium]|nr:methionine ABC transporter ATP-binding protein [Bacillota bacterium]HHU91792.1 methionine ABC transporter ATP-binding protein [Halanaerobiaceae bacterium]
MIEIKGLVKNYSTGQGLLHAVNGVDLKVREGEIFGIIGPSGAGKSTLIRTLNLLETPDAGSIKINGKEISTLRGKELRDFRRKIGMIFQHFNLLSSRTVRDNIAFPLEIAGIPVQEREKRVDRLMELVGLSAHADHYPSELSGGQKQRVGIARALANEPALLLSDEATSSLDPESTEATLELLRKIRDELNLTIVLITHEMDVIKKVCDRVAVLENGKIIEEGEVIDIFVNPRQELTRRFIKTVIDYSLPEGLEDMVIKGDLVRVTFKGESTHQPLMSLLVKKFQIDANILYGRIDDIQGIPFGTLILELRPNGGSIDKALDFLREKGLAIEVLKNG